MSWGSPTWVKEMPYANAATRYNFRSGGAGPLTLEFWITPFDSRRRPRGPAAARSSRC